MMSLVALPLNYKGIVVLAPNSPTTALSSSSFIIPSPSKGVPSFLSLSLRIADPDRFAPRSHTMGFNLTPSTSSLRTAAPEFSSFKRSAKAFSFKKASLNFHKSAQLTPRSSHDRFASSKPANSTTTATTTTTNSAPARVGADTPEFPYGDDVICISREDGFDSSSVDEISPDELQTPSNSPYASSYSSYSSSSSCHLQPEIEDQPLSPVDETMDEYDPRRESQVSMVSSWVDHHLQELDLSYNEQGIYEVEIFTTADGFPSRRDSFILPPGETFQSYQRKRNLPVVPLKQSSRLSRPLPSTPPASPGFNTQTKPVRPLPPPPSAW